MLFALSPYPYTRTKLFVYKYLYTHTHTHTHRCTGQVYDIQRVQTALGEYSTQSIRIVPYNDRPNVGGPGASIRFDGIDDMAAATIDVFPQSAFTGMYIQIIYIYTYTHIHIHTQAHTYIYMHTHVLVHAMIDLYRRPGSVCTL